MLNAISTPAAAAEKPEAPASAKIRDAARQFEALLIAQMLKSVNDSERGWMGSGEDTAGSSAMEYAQEMFAQALSANGGLGLSNMIVSGLKPGDPA
jgi:Rod binding domain-containing protein